MASAKRIARIGGLAVLLLPPLILAAARVQGSVSLAEPLQLFTSGDETASLFAVWKAAHGQDIYTSRFDRPFNAVFFNWLFYFSYGRVVAAVSAALGLGADWLPTIGRLFTLTGLGIAMTAFAVAARRAARPNPLPGGGIAAAVVTVFMGPLVGFWMVTVRPDVWALALEMVAMAWLLGWWQRRPLLALCGFAVAVWLAWSFKQAAVTSLAGIGLFLLLRRRWRLLALLVGLMAALFGATLAAGTAQYRATLLFSDVPLQFALSAMVHTMGLSLVKAVPVWLGLAVLIFLMVRGKRLAALWEDDRVVALAAATAAGVGLAGLATFQDAAAENYLFVPTANGALLLLALWARLPAAHGRSALAAMGAGLVVLAGLSGAVLSGRIGVVDLRPMGARFAQLRQCVADLPRPLFITNQYVALPWMAPDTEPFVLSYTYQRDRDRGRTFQDGGVGGLVAAGHFAAIAIPGGEDVAMLDGAPLAGYIRQPDRCINVAIWLRADAAP